MRALHACPPCTIGAERRTNPRRPRAARRRARCALPLHLKRTRRCVEATTGSTAVLTLRAAPGRLSRGSKITNPVRQTSWDTQQSRAHNSPQRVCTYVNQCLSAVSLLCMRAVQEVDAETRFGTGGRRAFGAVCRPPSRQPPCRGFKVRGYGPLHNLRRSPVTYRAKLSAGARSSRLRSKHPR